MRIEIDSAESNYLLRKSNPTACLVRWKPVFRDYG